MGHDHGGAAFHQAGQRLLHQPLGLVVERGGGLVEDEDGRVLEDGAGDGHALSLATGEPRTAIADDRLVAVRQLADEVVGVGRPCGCLQLLVARVESAVADVLLDGAAEDGGVLGHQRHGLAQ